MSDSVRSRAKDTILKNKRLRLEIIKRRNVEGKGIKKSTKPFGARYEVRVPSTGVRG